MIELDGSGGGGQLLRTALSLSALTGRPFTMEGIRRARSTPGLRPQHLAAVRVLADVTDASVAGAAVGSSELSFEPGPIEAGQYTVDVGTSGSLPLLFDTVLPLATGIEAPLSLRAIGGTDVRWAPSIDYFRRVKLPMLRRHGVPVAVDVARRGFYPAGGGEATLSLGPAGIRPLELDPSDDPTGARVYSVATTDLTERDVGARQAASACERLSDLGMTVTERIVGCVHAESTGSVIVVQISGSRSVAGGDALGEQGIPAERIGIRAVEPVREVIDTEATVDVHLADQLLVFLAIAGGQIRTPRSSDHIETNLDVLDAFGYAVSIEAGDSVVLRSV